MMESPHDPAIRVGSLVRYYSDVRREGNEARVTGLELIRDPDDPKYGIPVPEISNAEMVTERWIMDLDDGHFAYGDYLEAVLEL